MFQEDGVVLGVWVWCSFIYFFGTVDWRSTGFLSSTRRAEKLLGTTIYILYDYIRFSWGTTTRHDTRFFRSFFLHDFTCSTPLHDVTPLPLLFHGFHIYLRHDPIAVFIFILLASFILPLPTLLHSSTTFPKCHDPKQQF